MSGLALQNEYLNLGAFSESARFINKIKKWALKGRDLIFTLLEHAN